MIPIAKRRLALISTLCLTFLLTAWPGSATGPALDAFIERQMERAHVPGLAAGIVRDGELVWSRGYGWADVERALPVTVDTKFNLASVSKTLTGTAVMQLAEDGLLELDADIHRYLPFRIRHPRHRSKPITARRLLMHTASIRDDEELMDSLYVEGDSEVSLRSLLRDYLHPRGRYYDPAQNFYRSAPGRAFEYSNFGYALLALLVEGASGQPFDVYCRERIFEPLAMPGTSWRLRDLDPAEVALPYAFRRGGFRSYGHYGYPDYPSGLLRSSVRELSHFVIAHLENGRFSGSRILRPATVRAMRTEARPAVAPDMGLAFFADRRRGIDLWGHNGGDYGVSTEMWLAPEKGFGVILLANGDAFRPREERAMQKILLRLLQEADTGR